MDKVNEEQLEAEKAAYAKVKAAIKKLDVRVMGPGTPEVKLTAEQKEELEKVIKERNDFFLSKPKKSKANKKFALGLMLRLATILYGPDDVDVKELSEAFKLLPE